MAVAPGTGPASGDRSFGGDIPRRISGVTRRLRVWLSRNHRQGLPFSSIGLIVITLALIWGGLAAFAWNQRQSARENALQDTGNMARGFAEHVNRTIEGVEQVMLLLRAAYASDPSQINLARWAAPRAFRNDLTLQVAIIGPDGILRDSNLGMPDEPTDLSDRPHFRLQRQDSGDKLYISAPVLGRVSGKWTIQLTRKLFNAQGQFAGVVVVSLDTSYLATFYQSLDIGSGDITLVGTDGIVRAHAPAAQDQIGRSLVNTSLAPMLAVAPTGTVLAESPFGGTLEQYSYRRLAAYPLLVAVGLSMSEELEPAKRLTQYGELLAVGLTLLVLISGAALLRRDLWLRRSQQALAGKNSDLLQSAARLRDSELQLRQFIETVPLRLAIFDHDDRYLAVSRQYLEAELRASSPAAVIGRRIGELLPGLDSRWRERRRRCVAGEILSSECEASLSPAGETIWVRWEMRPWRDASGQIGGVVYCADDITARIETEAALRQSHKMEALGQLTGGIAHDFNNLLAVVALNAELLAEQFTTLPHLLPMVNGILAGARSGADLTQRLLAYARRQTLQPKVIDLVELLGEQVVLIRRAIGSGITVDLVVAPDVAPVEVDRSQLGDVLLNLAINARDAMPRGGRIRIEAANVPAADPQDPARAQSDSLVKISVRDTGTGMTAETLARATDPFFTTKAVGKGSGLGLSMVDGFVRQSGGHMTITSQPGEGCEVSLFLPVAADQPVRLERPLDVVPVARNNEHVLVVDDNDEVREAVALMLESLGYRVSNAAGGSVAMSLLTGGGRVDLLVTDILMPDGISGPQLAEMARSQWPDMPVLFVSGFMPTEEQATFKVPAEQLLRKPFTRRALAEAVRAAIDRQAMASA